MKKAILLLLMFAILIPSQVLAAKATKAMSTSEIEKIYFEDYKGRVKEIRIAQKHLNAVLGAEVRELTQRLSQASARYKNEVKNKSSKAVIAQAKADCDKLKKQLGVAKVELNKTVKNYKKESEQALKDIANQKAELIKFIKNHTAGKDKLTESQFSKQVNGGISSINGSFTGILKMLTEAE
ncbi:MULTISPECIES: hypothetical protein [Paenibacillus]|uniref:hypothetical protein n=1 Tax=Paenibacillus TaxID=44249 RepID=UPI000CDA5F64|nr:MULTISPECIES: hypothetical protein [Paenibacillus]POR29977.1 hypothetical protein CG775_02505 [Paenibacillus polymyxa]QYK66479.1 hypothetical protein KAI36_01622 [Paenibacillus sp. S02]